MMISFGVIDCSILFNTPTVTAKDRIQFFGALIKTDLYVPPLTVLASVAFATAGYLASPIHATSIGSYRKNILYAAAIAAAYPILYTRIFIWDRIMTIVRVSEQVKTG